MDKSVLLSYYKRKDIQERMVYHAKNREIAVKYADFFGKRPETLEYPGDVLEFAKNGATSFHVSEEIWENPSLLSSTMSKKEQEDLRIGWDLVLDIDCKFIEYSKIAAYYVVNALRREGIEKVSCKFSGNKGFHIGIPFESFPGKVNNVNVAKLFPEAPRKIAEYIKAQIKKPVAKKILEMNNFEEIIEKTGLKKEEITYCEKNEFGDEVLRLNVEPFLNIDTILISTRHLYRMPYSLHEKSGFASLPIDSRKILEFNKEDANPKTLKVSEFVFMERENPRPGECQNLFLNAFDFTGKSEIEKTSREETGKKIFDEKDFEEISKEIPEEFFPPCIKQILLGLKDGRKRAVLILINFLSSVGWSHERIEERLKEWNKLNQEPLRENYTIGQLRYHKQQKKKVLPPNCENKMYYSDLGLKCGDCNFKNPVSYVRKKLWILNKQQERDEGKKKKKDTKPEIH
jgi:DNA primase catalytic subunit